MSYTPNYENLPASTKAAVRRWMRLYHREYDSPTHLAEGCGEALGLADASPDAVIPEEVYDIALAFFEEE